MTTKSEVQFRYGVANKSFEQQANEQGYTLGNRADYLQYLGNALAILRMNEILTQSQYNSAIKKLHAQLVAEVRPQAGIV